MEILAATMRLAGEISERAELLNGAIQLTLDGATIGGGDAEWAIEAALSWRLGRAGAVDLDEGDLTLTSGDSELVALLDQGSAELEEDTGSVDVRAMFSVESATAIGFEPGATLSGRFEIGAESWTGELGVTDGV